MDIVKRDGSIQNFDKKKIEDAVIKVFTGTNTICNKDLCKDISRGNRNDLFILSNDSLC